MRVRRMTAADIEAVSELRVRAWQFAYADLMPRSYLASMSVAEDAARRREMFAAGPGTVTNLLTEADGGRITGWAALGPYRPEGPHGHGRPHEDAELYALYVRPELIGTGVGRALMSTCLERAAAQDFPRLLLWVIRANARARRFYEHAGFALDGAQDTHDVEGTRVPLVRYARPLLKDAV
ncbi:MAG TPA: GNAT family N-acetyltransferase [Streptomyces sp.]|nr:GNAT family N-acetyltransferase [Streptomyces sp.]